MKKKQNAYYIRAPSLCLSSCKKPNKASPFVCDFALKDTFTIYHNHERHPRNIQKKLIIPQLQLLCLIFEQKRILNEKIINSRIEVIS